MFNLAQWCKKKSTVFTNRVSKIWPRCLCAARESKELTLLLVRDCQERSCSITANDEQMDLLNTPSKRNLNWNVDDSWAFIRRVCGKRWTASFSFLIDGLCYGAIDRPYVLTVKSQKCWFFCGTYCNIILMASYIKSRYQIFVQDIQDYQVTYLSTVCKDAYLLNTASFHERADRFDPFFPSLDLAECKIWNRHFGEFCCTPLHFNGLFFPVYRKAKSTQPCQAIMFHESIHIRFISNCEFIHLSIHIMFHESIHIMVHISAHRFRFRLIISWASFNWLV